MFITELAAAVKFGLFAAVVGVLLATACAPAPVQGPSKTDDRSSFSVTDYPQANGVHCYVVTHSYTTDSSGAISCLQVKS